MPKKLHEYRWDDWFHLRPITHAIKTRRYRQIDRRYLLTDANAANLDEIRVQVTDRQVVVVVAFNDAETIRWQAELMARNLPHVLYVVLDNSTSSVASELLQKYCCSEAISYVRLNYNPWNGKNASRSHGFAMNWTWRNLLLPGKPRQFGFIDHDLFPTVPSDPFHPLEDRICYGDIRWSGSRWFLWAGFCFFDFAAVAELPLDFGLDWFVGLDTGGANWEVLYRHLDRNAIKQRVIRQVSVWPDVPKADAYFEWRDDWLHEVGLDGLVELKPLKRAKLASLLGSVSDARGSLPRGNGNWRSKIA